VKAEGAAGLLSALPAQRWAVVTSGTRSLAMTRLKHTALPVPPVLITADDVRVGKPHPEAYELASARLDLTPETCIVVEDAPAGIRAAHAAECVSSPSRPRIRWTISARPMRERCV
jgi:mannitol-1-/sugar-/sorbitol-6-phosphatase